MAKKPIYLDDRERDLARRVCAVVGEELEGRGIGDIQKFAIHWTQSEVRALREKFAEPSSIYAPPRPEGD